MKNESIEITENKQDRESNREQINLEIVKTNDGSSTLFHPLIGEHYHSRHGALQESKHVFLNSGLQFFLNKKNSLNGSSTNRVSILEVGFGTGLNYLLTADYCLKNKITLHYTGIERYPLPKDLIDETNYAAFVDKSLANSFYFNYPIILEKNEETTILENSYLEIALLDVLKFQSNKTFDVLYFDAFSAIHQPEMWTKELLAHLSNFLNPGGVFITYAITGNLKRTMKSLGFEIEKVPGAPGKREMLRAISPL